MKLITRVMLLVALVAGVLAGRPLNGRSEPAAVPRKCMICQDRLLNCLGDPEAGLNYDGCEKAICKNYRGCDTCGFKPENCGKGKGLDGSMEVDEDVDDTFDAPEASN